MIKLDQSCSDNYQRLLFTGDTMLTSNFWRSDPLSDPVNTAIIDADLGMTNLEAPIADGEPKPKWGPVIKTDESTIDLISSVGFDAASLANNHMLDYGFEGAEFTKNSCKDAGLDTAGIGSTPAEAVEPIRTVLGDTSIVIFSVAQREFGMADNDRAGAAWSHHPKTIQAIKAESDRSDIVIVNAHGGLEHIPTPPLNWVHQLREFVDAGADAVIGHHPHVAQGWETRDDSVIFYSLGNWLTYQPHPGTQWSFFVEICIRNRELHHAEVTLTEQQDGIIQKMKSRDRSSHKQYLIRSGELSGDRAIWQAIATHLFEEEYSRRLSDWSSSIIGTLTSEPIWALDRLTQDFSRDLDRSEKDLSIINYLQNESHSEAIRTALELRSGVISDRRTPQVNEDVEYLLEFVSKTPNESFTERMNRRIKTVIRRIKE